MSTNKTQKAAVVIAPQAGELIRFAAAELCGYLEKLFAVEAVVTDGPPPDAETVFYVGAREENPYFAANGQPEALRVAGKQAVLLRRVAATSMVLSGGSPVAVLWAVYELAARWGVEFLLRTDVLPDKRELYLPDLDRCEEPLEPVRTWALIYGLPFGAESWGIADCESLLAQLAKLRFNRIYIQFYPEFPHMDLQVGGIRRSTTGLFFNYHYPITDDMVGRELFDDRGEFWNRDLPIGATCSEMLAAGQKLVHGIIACAHRHGLEVAMGVLPLEYLKEFAPAIKDPLVIKLLGTETVVPGPSVKVEDDLLSEMALATVRATVENYPEVDVIAPVLPEFRDWVEYSETAWRALDQKYGIETLCTYAKVLEKAAGRTEYPGGAARAVKEVRGDIVALYFYDLFFAERKAMSHTRRPDMRVMYMYLAEELYPILARVLPPGTEVTHYVDYTPTRVLRRREVLKAIPSGTVHTMCYTLHDDNVGFLPMVAAESLGELLATTRQAGWKGFMSRYWLTSDHDLCVNYLAHAMWDKEQSNFGTYSRLLAALCGEACVYALRGMFRELENATVVLERDALGFAFPVPAMVSYHWEKKEPSRGMAEVRLDYERALDWARQARPQASAKGVWFVDYWINRIAFGIGYIRMTEAVFAGGQAAARGDMPEARAQVQQALTLALEAGACYAKAARDRSDVASIAIFNEYGIRYLRKKLVEIDTRTENSAVTDQSGIPNFR
jgi:hypothetical protein